MVSKLQQEELLSLVKKAGDRLLHHWPGAANLEKALNITQKKDGSFVTNADFESNEILISGLKRLFPTDGIFSEELARDEALRMAHRAWIIDPLDGTQSFIDGNDDFSILLGLCVGTHIDFGVMYFPVRNLIAVGQKGGGSWLNGKRLTVSTSDEIRDRSVYLRHCSFGPPTYAYDRWMDSGMAFLNVARGDFDGIILKLVHHQEWDLAAPAVMIQEAGGVLTDERGEPIEFKKGPVQYRYLVASNGKVHKDLLSLIKEGE